VPEVTQIFPADGDTGNGVGGRPDRGSRAGRRSPLRCWD